MNCLRLIEIEYISIPVQEIALPVLFLSCFHCVKQLRLALRLGVLAAFSPTGRHA